MSGPYHAEPAQLSSTAHGRSFPSPPQALPSSLHTPSHPSAASNLPSSSSLVTHDAESSNLPFRAQTEQHPQESNPYIPMQIEQQGRGLQHQQQDPRAVVQVPQLVTQTSDTSTSSTASSSSYQIPPTYQPKPPPRGIPLSLSTTDYNEFGALNPTSANTHMVQLDLATHPIPDMLLMLSSLLQKIVNENDQYHTSLAQTHQQIQPLHLSDTALRPTAQPQPQQKRPPSFLQSQPMKRGGSFASARQVTSDSLLAFHARNIPSISIYSYLARILKYCPTTNEVFISLLVYFDRMSKRATQYTTLTMEQQQQQQQESPAPPPPALPPGHSHDTFAVDSYNVHRLIIAGITVSSKFFSDVFYTNSRYAKVVYLILALTNKRLGRRTTIVGTQSSRTEFSATFGFWALHITRGFTGLRE